MRKPFTRTSASANGSDQPAAGVLGKSRADLFRRLRRILPPIALLTPTLFWRTSFVAPGFMATWLSTLQLLACLALTAIFILRKHVSISVSVVVVTICLYTNGFSVIGFSDPLTALALGIALLFALLAFSLLVETEGAFTQATIDFENASKPSSSFLQGESSIMQSTTNLVATDNAPFTQSHDLEAAAYALSHDLRAPLRAIEGFSRALLDDLGTSITSAAARDVAEIRAGVERMQSMVSRWLAFARDGKAAITHERVDLSAVAESIIAELRIAEPQRQVTTTVSPDMIVAGDAVLLRELLQNLIGNAWKFSRDRAQLACIEIGVHKTDTSNHDEYIQDRQAIYFVRDNGIGFSQAEADTLFTAFTRLPSSTAFEGSGIGLAIAHNVIERHRGRIWAEGKPDNGAIFNFTLPRDIPERTGPARTGERRDSLALPDRNRSIFDFRRNV